MIVRGLIRLSRSVARRMDTNGGSGIKTVGAPKIGMTATFNTRGLDSLEGALGSIVESAMHDIADDLTRVSSETAPHDKGVLEKSFSKDVVSQGSKVTATVTYSVSENSSGGSYNYALKMHEDDYNLGAGSQAKPGGKGMSGKTYPVGKKFLTRPLYGEAGAYKEHIEKTLDKAIKDREIK
ncbi:hypothetical protein [Ammoniphilus sp. CFH 90114]|uniref:hypothetical protein n=1 Tax=Ammoniphilus sp. CFH 90114 TaxID=2493665 RepID=UPI00100ECC37|nr:hypothetical protein [Ammoniphilus sp. CFH 90114]RXT14906.1 hypothetical protein EIZ39_01455 [Ammoniphilus sp. CFH 90114]